MNNHVTPLPQKICIASIAEHIWFKGQRGSDSSAELGRLFLHEASLGGLVCGLCQLCMVKQQFVPSGEGVLQ